MIMDNMLRLMSAQTLTTGGGSATSGGTALQSSSALDLGVGRDIGVGLEGLAAKIVFGGSQMVITQATTAFFQILIVADQSDPSLLVSPTTEVIGVSPLWGNSTGYGAGTLVLNGGTLPRPGSVFYVPLMPMATSIDITTNTYGRIISPNDGATFKNSAGVTNTIVSAGSALPMPRRYVAAWFLLTMPGSVTAAQITTSATFTIDLVEIPDNSARLYPTTNPLVGLGTDGTSNIAT
jgi:hypothetical protein